MSNPPENQPPTEKKANHDQAALKDPIASVPKRQEPKLPEENKTNSGQAASDGPIAVMSKIPKYQKKPNYDQVASDGLVALLSAGNQSTDGVPIAKGVLGGILWIVETCRQFKSNKQGWESFARYLLDLHDDLINELDHAIDNPPVRVIGDFRKLQRSLASVATEMNNMKTRSGFLKLVQVREDPKRIAEFRQIIIDAINKFNVLQILSIRTALDAIKTEVVTATRSESEVLVIGPPQLRPVVHLKCCPPPTPLFTGRRDVIDTMHAAFASKATNRHIFVLYGLGGAGKSQIAYKFVDESQGEKKLARFSEVFYVDASSEASIKADLEGVARAKGIGKSVQATLCWLCAQRKEWLLIFNNADNIYIPLMKYFPSCSHGNILITSRNRDTRTHAYPHQLQCRIADMNQDDAMSLFLVASGIEEQSKAEKEKELAIGIVKALGHLALGLIQAGAYISKTGCSLHDYCELYRKRQRELLEEYQDNIQRADDYQGTVYTTWKISFEQLTDTAQHFLQLCACLHFDGIPDVIFRNAANTSDIPPTSPESPAMRNLRHFLENFSSEDCAWDIIKFNRVLSSVQSYSLMDSDPRNQTYSIHPLVQDWTLSTVTDIPNTRVEAQHLIAFSVHQKYTSDDFTFRRSLLVHVDAVFDPQEGVDVNVAPKFAHIYKETGRWKEAGTLWATVVETRKQVLGDDHPDTLTSIDNLAWTTSSQGRWKEAEVLQVTVVEARKRVLGGEHQDTLSSMDYLAIIYLNLGQWKEAETLQVTVMEKRKQVLGEEHPDTLESISHLASIYYNQGRWKEAEVLQETKIEAAKCVLGSEHPETLVCMANLASTYSKQGRWREAEALGAAVMEKEKQVFGEEHPHTLGCMINLADTYLKQGRCEEAEALQETAMEACKRVHGSEAPATLISTSHLASIYLKQGRWREAEALEVPVMEKKKQVFGEEHADTLKSIANLASTYGKQGRWTEAEPLVVRVMDARKRVLGNEHPDTLKSIADLADIYRKQGRIDEAEFLELELELE